MFDIAPSEFVLVAFVALIVIGPKDLPKALRLAGYWVGKARGVARQFRSGFDAMVREAELEELEKKWKAENERIMREHPAEPSDVAHNDQLPADQLPADRLHVDEPATVTQPVIVDHPVVAAPEPGIDHAASPPPREGAAS